MQFPHSSQLDLWLIRLDEDLYQSSNAPLLSAEEMARAVKFKFELHRKRFITARAGLRSILSLYLDIEPQNIQLSATPKGKPFVENCDLQFNASHSHDFALYAFIQQNPVGVDIEKIRSHYNDAVAERFFSSEEYEAFTKLPPEKKRAQFFKTWTGKEALVKALGEGLGYPLSTFTIPLQGRTQEIKLNHQGTDQVWYLENLDLFPDYQAAYATNKKMTQLSYFEWTAEGKKNWRKEEQRS